MNRQSGMIAALLVVAMVFTLPAIADQKSKETVVCPVSGKEITKSEAKATYEYKGKTYYFCCEACVEPFKKNPEMYLSQKGEAREMHGHQHGEETAVDPVCGGKVEKAEAKYTYEHEGKTYYFHSAECKEKFMKSPSKYIPADENMVKCPVSGKSFKKSEAAGSMEYNGKTYYFCCASCEKTFKENPEKYVKKK
ncbi:MAG: YHS domain-containing protein [Candidatus Aminicenantales bacterium]